MICNRVGKLDSLVENCRGHLREVASCGGRVQDGQLEALVWADDKDSPCGQGQALGILLIRVQHPIPGQALGRDPYRSSHGGQ